MFLSVSTSTSSGIFAIGPIFLKSSLSFQLIAYSSGVIVLSPVLKSTLATSDSADLSKVDVEALPFASSSSDLSAATVSVTVAIAAVGCLIVAVSILATSVSAATPPVTAS